MNADQVIFNSLFPVWLVAIASILLAASFTWSELQRKHRYLVLRIVAQLIIILSLAALILRPSIKQEKNSGSALLLTKGYNKTTADSLVTKHGLRTIQSADAGSYPRSKKTSSWHLLQEDAKDIRFVLGEGIPSSALEEYDFHFDYIENKIPQGIVQIDLSSLKKDQLNFIKGEVNYTNGPALLKLTGPAGSEDSVQIKGNGITSFSLRTLPKQEGRFIYQLDLSAEGKTIESNSLPLEVLSEQKLTILFVQQYPTFETRYLKNYLGDKGHAITMRYQVSKNIYRYEYANRDKQLLPKLTADILNALDLLIITPEALAELSQNEMQVLDAAIQNGLGMILTFSKPVKNIQRFFRYELNAVNKDTVTLNSSQWKSRLTFPAAPWRIKASPSLHELFSDTDHQLLSGYFYHGIGITAFQFINETFHLALEGKSSEYASVWAPLIEKSARKQNQKFRIRIVTPFPYAVDEPLHFEITSTTEAPELNYDSLRISLKEDIGISQLWHGTVWSDAVDWHQFTLQDSSTLHFYTADNKEWNALRMNNQAKSNSLFTSQGNASNTVITEYEPLSPLLFFILFVLASGALWLLAKL